MGKYIFFISASFLLSCKAFPQKDMPSDARATKETVNLYHNLKKLALKGFMFGHQDDLAYGVGWRYESGRSDVKDVTGDYPGLYGWELGGLERTDDNKNIDGVPFDSMKKFIREGYERGAVITMSWHFNNPLTNGTAWDTTHGAVASVLPGGANNDTYKAWLDKAAAFFLSLKGKHGELIPVLFRPFHELTGNWFWWCKNTCSDDEFKALWHYTVNYLQETKKVHNLLYVYNTADFNSADEYLARYPGDDVADILTFDGYQYDDPQTSDGFVKKLNAELDIIDRIATQKGKLFAIAETGYEQIPYAEWWTQTLLKAIGDHKISYVLVWRNHGYNETMKRMHYYAPYKGHPSSADFIKFYELQQTLFEKDVNKEKLYK
jgi:mannan endo-1,4-beta-mannosidase